MSHASQPRLHASDPVALAVESHVRSMEAAGYGEFSGHEEEGNVVLDFGSVEVRGENCDVALLRLASALLDHPKYFRPFFDYMRNTSKNPPAVYHRDNYLTVRTTAGRS